MKWRRNLSILALIIFCCESCNYNNYGCYYNSYDKYKFYTSETKRLIIENGQWSMEDLDPDEIRPIECVKINYNKDIFADNCIRSVCITIGGKQEKLYGSPLQPYKPITGRGGVPWKAAGIIGGTIPEAIKHLSMCNNYDSSLQSPLREFDINILKDIYSQVYFAGLPYLIGYKNNWYIYFYSYNNV